MVPFNAAAGTNLGQLCTLDSSTLQDLIEDGDVGGVGGVGGGWGGWGGGGWVGDTDRAGNRRMSM